DKQTAHSISKPPSNVTFPLSLKQMASICLFAKSSQVDLDIDESVGSILMDGLISSISFYYRNYDLHKEAGKEKMLGEVAFDLLKLSSRFQMFELRGEKKIIDTIDSFV